MLPPIQTASTYWQQADHPHSDFWALRSGTLHQPANPPYQVAAAPAAPYQQHSFSRYPAALAQSFSPPEYLPVYAAQQPLGWPPPIAAAPLHPTSAHHQQHAAHPLQYMSEQHNTRQRRPQRQQAASRPRSYAADDDDWEADAEENDGSCSSADLSYSSRHRDTGPATAAAAAAASSGGRRGHAPASIKTAQRWTQEEHDLLAAAVARFGNSRRWSEIAKHIPGRTGKQCRERWVNHMNPDCKKGSWDVAEELLLCKWHSILGSHWARITRKLEGRTENAVKNHWNAAMRSKYPMRRSTPLNMYVSHLRNNVEPSDALVKVLEALQEAHPELVAQTARAAADIVSRRLNPQSGAALGMPPNSMAATGAQIQQLGALGGFAGGAPMLPPASGGSGPSAANAAAPARRETAANLAAFFETAAQPASQQQQQLLLQDRSPSAGAPQAVLAAAQMQPLQQQQQQQQPGMQWAGAVAAATDAWAGQTSPFAGAEGAAAAAAAAATRTPTRKLDTRLVPASPGQLSLYAPSVMRTGPAAAVPAAGEAGGPATKRPRTSNSTHSTGSDVAAAASGGAAVAAAIAREAAAGQQQQQLQSPGAAGAAQQFAFHSPNMASSQSNSTAAGRSHQEMPQQLLLPQGQLSAPPPLFQAAAPYQQQQPNPVVAAAAARGTTVTVFEKMMVLATDAVIAVQDGAARILFELEEGLRRQQVVAAAVAAAEQQQLLSHAAHHLPGGPAALHTPQQHLMRTHTAPAAQLQHWQNQQQWYHTAAPHHLQQQQQHLQQHLDHSAPEPHPSISSGDSFGAMLAVISGAPATGAAAGQRTNLTLPAAGLRLAGLGSLASAVGSASGAGHGDGRASLSGLQGNQPSTPISAALALQAHPLAPSWSRNGWQQQQPQLQRSLSEFPRGSTWLEAQLAVARPDMPMEASGLSPLHWQQQQQHSGSGAAAGPMHGKTVTTDAPAGRPLARTISAPAVRHPSPTVWARDGGNGAQATGTAGDVADAVGSELAVLPSSDHHHDGLEAPNPAVSLPAVSGGGPGSGELQPLYDQPSEPLPPSTLQFQDVEAMQDNADKELLDMLSH